MTASLTPPTSPPDALRAVRPALLDWYDENRRDLPWRERGDASSAPDPHRAYRVWVSEVMLQQTRVETVRPYFTRWIARFPTVRDLAEAPLDDVLKTWEGLGYYSRARNLHGAARIVAESHGGVVPDDPDTFRSLPGVGRYTAGAVMSIAYGLREPVVDGNVRRVLARWLDLAAPRDGELWAAASALVEGERPGDLNQALMELGSTVCTPRAPSCGRCPASDHCAARRADTQEERPVPRKRGPLPHEETAVAIVERGGRLLLARKPVDSRLGGMWEFPGVLRSAGESARCAVERGLREALELSASAGAELGVVERVFTHVRVTYRIVRCSAPIGEARPVLFDEVAWIAPTELGSVALPAAQKRIAALVLASRYS